MSRQVTQRVKAGPSQRGKIHSRAERDAGDHVDIPVVGRCRKKVRDPVAGRFLFAAREQHANAIEVGFRRCGIEPKRFIEGAPRVHDVNLPAKSVTNILQFRDAKPGPA